MRFDIAAEDVTPPAHARRAFLVLRTDHPRGAPDTGRARVVGVHRWHWLAWLHAKALAWLLRRGRPPWGIVAVTLSVTEAHVWEDEE